MTDAQDVVCFRCGAPAEAGFVAAARGIFWAARPEGRLRRLRWGDEMLTRHRGPLGWLTGLTALAAHRCRRCRLVWFVA
jgi:hypothetical protein